MMKAVHNVEGNAPEWESTLLTNMLRREVSINAIHINAHHTMMVTL